MLDRRSLLKGGLAGTVAAGLAPAASAATSGGRFTHGVASGDPTARSIILWTRYVPADSGAGALRWEIAQDETFGSIVRSGTATARADRDFTVKVDAAGLTPGQRYAFRFYDARGLASPTGLTRTLPEGAADRLKIAVLSCANLPFGYFNAYGHCAAQEDIDLTLHLGDYIYEQERGRYPTPEQSLPGRTIEPAHEAVRLQDYRSRYASYRLDPDLQELHRRKPMIVVWDDHEIANDTWRGGAGSHQPESEGPWERRWRAAYQAFCEWLPIREQAEGVIYRRFDWGNLASLIMVDARFIGRDEEMSYAPILAQADPADGEALARRLRVFYDEQVRNPKRSLLGQTQEQWLAQQLADSKTRGAPWQVIGQQILVNTLNLSPALTQYLRPGLEQRLVDRVRIGGLLGGQGVPGRLGAWSGYPAARDRLLADILANANNTIILTGDTHNGWAFEVVDEVTGQTAAVELGTPSVTSPGWDLYSDDPAAAQPHYLAANPSLKWCDLSRRGYLTVDFSPQAATAEWVLMKTIRERSTALAETVRLRLPATAGPGAGQLQSV